MMSDTLKERQIQRITLRESKTAAELLVELNFTTNHIVLVDGKRVDLDFQIQENDRVIILPLIAGG
ncbi:MoaD/ThiS family protein [Candidatus Thorarchaeota archaeon]|nr:MAG: MoaD/ThiS family protein [Candidatus Thorarchaeota archaeon]